MPQLPHGHQPQLNADIGFRSGTRSRAVIRHRGGSCGTHSVNVLRSQACSSHFHRNLTHRKATGSAARRTSRGRVKHRQPQYAGATILVAGTDFGTGSSREHAVWALTDYGFRAVITPGSVISSAPTRPRPVCYR